MSSIKSIMEKHAKAFQNNEIKRFNEVVSMVIDKELTKRNKDGRLESRYFIELTPDSSHTTFLVALKKTSDPTGPDITLTTFSSLLPLSVIRNVFIESYGKESEYYSDRYKCPVYLYSFDFIEIANR